VRTAFRLFGITLLLAVAGNAAAQTIFACEPEWGALTKVLLPQARVHVATHHRQNPHHIEARPALIAQLRGADAAICTGASLEAAWLPLLQQRSGNANVQPGANGMFFAASAVDLIDARPGVGGNPFAGDVHGEGNPHFHVDPRRVDRVLDAWSQRLQALFPMHASEIVRRHAAFKTRWGERIQEWERRASSVRGRSVAAQHSTFAYLWQWLGITQVADLEPKPGMPPSPAHLQSLLDRLRANPPAAIVINSYQDPRPGKWLSEQLGGVRWIQLAATVEDADAPDALVRWMDQLVVELLKT